MLKTDMSESSKTPESEFGLPRMLNTTEILPPAGTETPAQIQPDAELPHEQETPTCRFCYEPGLPNRPLFYPCKCSGTIQYIHTDCVLNWILTSGKDTCTTCGYRFHFQKIYSPDLPQSIGVRNILSTIFSPITNILFKDKLLIEVLFIHILVPLLTIARCRKHFYSDSELLDFPLELISPYGILTDMISGVSYACTVLILGSIGYLEEYISKHEGRYPEWLNQQNPIAGYKILWSSTKVYFGIEDEDFDEVELEPAPRHRIINFWRLTLKQKLIYIHFFYPLTRIPIQCVEQIAISCGLVLMLDYVPFWIGGCLVGAFELGWLKYWINLYVGYVLVTCTLWFVRYTWISGWIRDYLDLDYIHSCKRVLLLWIFVNFWHPLLISFLLDQSVKNLMPQQQSSKFLDYTAWELVFYVHVSMIYVFTILKLLEPILMINFSLEEKISASFQTLIKRLANRVWTTTVPIFLLFWIQTYLMNTFFGISLQNSNNSLSWTEKFCYLFLGLLAGSHTDFISNSLNALINELFNKTFGTFWMTGVIIYLMNFGLLIIPISIGQIIANLLPDNVQFGNFQNAINGAMILWIFYCMSFTLLEIFKIEYGRVTKMEIVKKITLMVLRACMNTTLFFGILPFLLGFVLSKYLFEPFGSDMHKAEGLGFWDYWIIGIFWIQLLVLTFPHFRNGLHLLSIMAPVVLITPLFILSSVPYVISQTICFVLWGFGYLEVSNSSIQKTAYLGFDFLITLLGLYYLCSILLNTGVDFVKSKYLVGNNLQNFKDKETVQQEDQSGEGSIVDDKED